MKRRDILKSGLMGVGASLVAPSSLWNVVSADNEPKDTKLKNNIRHSVCSWTYGHLSTEELCILVKNIGFSAIDLVGPKDWPMLKKHGIECSMCNGAELGLVDGWNDSRFHKQLIINYSILIDQVANAGYKNLICFSGNARGLDIEEGLQNCDRGLKKILAQAEKRGVTIQMELFNSKVDHPDYMADNSFWGLQLCNRLGSPNFKLLYDIYHMQISEGDIIRTIQDNHEHFGHYHTAGVPGRHEIDSTQELNYPAIMKAIVATGYEGYVAQEFIPTGKSNKDKEKALAEAIKICDV